MKKLLHHLVPALILSLCAVGCAGAEERLSYDKVHVYERPFDFTFLKTIQAVNNFENWILEETDKEKGILVFRNIEYGHLFDRDKQVARFVISRVGSDKTSVMLDPTTRKFEEAPEMFERIDSFVGAGSSASQT